MNHRSNGAAVKHALAELIETTLQTSGISQRELARRSGTTPTQISRMLNPEGRPVSLEAMLKVALVVKPTLRLVLVKAQAR
jgi:transcriptional regulator with XRE-family HTH domain